MYHSLDQLATIFKQHLLGGQHYHSEDGATCCSRNGILEESCQTYR